MNSYDQRISIVKEQTVSQISNPSINNVLEFPEGKFLLLGQGLYFLPHGHDKAYSCWGEQKELLGKIARTLETRAVDFKTYSVTYEFEDGQLLSARLISPRGRSVGVLADESLKKDLNDQLAAGLLTLVAKKNPPSIIRAARFADGRFLLLTENMDPASRDLGRMLLCGTHGNFQRIDNGSYIQGGNSFYFTATDGTRIGLPYGYGAPNHNEPPTYGDQELTYIKIKDPLDFTAFGISVPTQAPHLDPFCPELNPSRAPKAPSPKGP